MSKADVFFQLLFLAYLKINLPFQVSTRRRPSIVPELGSKVPHDIRQRYVNFFVEEFLKVSMTENEAFDKVCISYPPKMQDFF